MTSRRRCGARSVLVGGVLLLLAGGLTGQQVKLVAAGGAAGDLLGGGASTVGFSGGPGVAARGDVLVAGAFLDDVGGVLDAGSATLFRRVGSTWIEGETLLAPSPAPEAWFGAAVALADDVIVVGSPHDDEAGLVQAGSVSVFRDAGSGFVFEQRLVDPAGAPFDWFGTAVAVCGDVLAVGAPLGGVGGRVVVFRYDGVAWVFEQALAPSGAATADGFGGSLALCGGLLVGGSVLDDVGGSVARGSATVFRYDGSSWAEEQTLTAAGGAAGDLLGASVAARGDVIVAGAVGDDVGGNADQGSVSVFRYDGSSWAEQQTLTAAAGAAGDRFGSAVSLSADLLLVGAQAADPGGLAGAGAATLFRWNGTSFDEEATLTDMDGAAGDAFGGAVALCGGLAVAGAFADDVGAAVDQGSVWLTDLGESAWTDVGSALAGVNGDPLLVGGGSLCPGGDDALDLSNAAPSALAALFLAPSSSPVPFKGGSLVPFPFVGPVFVVTSPAGTIPLAFVGPGGVGPGLELWVQWAIVDAAAIHGVALSNAVRGVTP